MDYDNSALTFKDLASKPILAIAGVRRGVHPLLFPGPHQRAFFSASSRLLYPTAFAAHCNLPQILPATFSAMALRRPAESPIFFAKGFACPAIAGKGLRVVVGGAPFQRALKSLHVLT
jgi:hypothetical protein